MQIKSFHIKPNENLDDIVNSYITDNLSTNTIDDIKINSFYIPQGGNFGVNHIVLITFS